MWYSFLLSQRIKITPTHYWQIKLIVSLLSWANKKVHKLLMIRTNLLSIVFIGYMWSERRRTRILILLFYLLYDLHSSGTILKSVTEVPLKEEYKIMRGKLLFIVEACTYIHIFTKFDGKFWYDYIFHKMFLRFSIRKAEIVEQGCLILNN